MDITEQTNKIQEFLETEYYKEILDLNKQSNTLTIDFLKLSKRILEVSVGLIDNTWETIKIIRKAIININPEINFHINIQIKNYSEKEEEELMNVKGLIKEISMEQSSDILMALIKDRTKATEIIVQEIEKRETIYTLRDDENPEMYIYQNGIFTENAKTYIREYCRQRLGKAHTTNLANQVIFKIETDTYISSEKFFQEANQKYIPLENGIYNIETNKLEPFTPKLRFFNKLPIKYDPKAKCEMFKKHLKETTKNPKKDIKVLQEFIGHIFKRENKYQKAIILSGLGRNGKGVTIQFIQYLIGNQNCLNASLKRIEQDEWILGVFQGKLANLSGEVGSTKIYETANLKDLLGNDMLTANRKFKSTINFVNYAKMFFSANKIPIIADDTAGFWEKWIGIEFPFEFKDKKVYDKLKDKTGFKIKNPNLLEELKTEEELSGVFNWALRGLKRLEEQKSFTINETSKDIRSFWIRKSDSFKSFCMTNIVEDYESTITKDELRRSYSLYCREHRIVGTGDKHIKQILIEDFGAWEDRDQSTGKGYIWKGIKFNYPSYVNYGNLPLCKKVNIPLGQNTLGKIGSLVITEENIKEVNVSNVSNECNDVSNQEALKLLNERLADNDNIKKSMLYLDEFTIVTLMNRTVFNQMKCKRYIDQALKEGMIIDIGKGLYKVVV